MRPLQSQNQTSKEQRNHESDHGLDQKIVALVVLNTKMGVVHEDFMSTKFEDCDTLQVAEIKREPKCQSNLKLVSSTIELSIGT